MKNTNILIVEDEALVAEDLKAHILEMGYQVSDIVDNGKDVLTLLEGSQPDLVMMDIVLQGNIDGIQIAEVIKEKYHIPVIYLTAYTDKEKLDRARATEPYGYLVKPFDERELQTTIAMALYKSAADRRLRESQRWARAVLSSIADAVITIDHNAQVTYINTAAEHLTGSNNAMGIGCSLNDVMKLSGDQQQILNSNISNMLQTGTDSTDMDMTNVDLVSSKGVNIPIEIRLGNIRHDDNELDGLVIAFHDITLQRQAREQLEQSNTELERRVDERTLALLQTNTELDLAKKQAEAASEAKSRFLTNMSHELRTPLNPILGYAELWKMDTSLSASQHKQVHEIYTSGRHLISLIDDILEVAESETGELTLQNVSFDLTELANHAVISHSESAEKQKLKLASVLPNPSLPFVKGDPSRILEILNRLLDNAIRFTPAGKVELMLEYNVVANDSITARFNITDTGIGVADKSKIFEPLTQLDDSRSRAHDGAGLGLSIAQRLVNLMGGQIGVEDNPGGGSQFWFELKLAIDK